MTTREKLVDDILDKQTPDGGWTFFGSTADPDMTGMAIQALAPYYNENSRVKAAVDTALGTLSLIQQENGAYASWGSENAASTAQVLAALSALGIDADIDARFIKNGRTIPEAITGFAADGGYAYSVGGSANALATQQSAYALASYYRVKEGRNSLYDMTDIRLNAGIDEVGDGGILVYSPIVQNAVLIIKTADGEVKSCAAELKAGTNSFDAQAADEVYLWNTLGKMQPLCEKWSK